MQDFHDEMGKAINEIVVRKNTHNLPKHIESEVIDLFLNDFLSSRSVQNYDYF